jgi:serine/threonine-protein kinase
VTDDDLDQDLTDTNSPLGTASYMAPEQLRSGKHVDARCDVYALGVILYECATGRRPFSDSSRYELMHAVLTAPVGLPSALRPELPAAFDAMVLRAMRRNPAERFASARALGLALAPFSTDEAFWLREFALPSRLSVLPTSSEATSAEGAFTLASGSSKRATLRPARTHAAVATGVACVLLAGSLVVLAAWSGLAVPAGSGVSRSRAPQRLATSSVLDQAPELPMAFAPTAMSAVLESAQPPALRRISEPERRPARAAVARSTVIPPAVPARLVTAHPDETGTNDAPILE